MLFLGDIYRLKQDYDEMDRGRLVRFVSRLHNNCIVHYYATGEYAEISFEDFSANFEHCHTRKFEVKEDERVIAYLQYLPDTEQYTLDLAPASTLYPYAKQPGRIIDEFEAKAWITDRVVPPGRANIDEILEQMGHAPDDYKDIYFIEYIQGKCVRDPYYICEVQP